ncbi:MAG: glycosyltransferase [Thermoplasmata archaeon]|nr:glycosyltransferase [Thermoplasmata archaeon]
MGSESGPRPFVSVVVTVKNEERGLARLFESLLVQEPPFEIVLIDALSHDRTWEIAESYRAKYPDLFRISRKFGSRGIGRNEGVRNARGALVAFIDGDCVADSRWLHEIRAGFADAPVVAGTTVAVGSTRYGELERVELFQKGNDVTYPSCNLGYRRELFESLGGFDPHFITAEDIDLNLRAVEHGAALHAVPSAIVYHQMRATLPRFLVQAFWNGYGRKQLTEKHGSLWGNYRVRRLLQSQRSVIAWARLAAAFGGYMVRVLTAGHRRLTQVDPPGGAPTASTPDPRR